LADQYSQCNGCPLRSRCLAQPPKIIPQARKNYPWHWSISPSSDEMRVDWGHYR
jgi:hypothetical protein